MCVLTYVQNEVPAVLNTKYKKKNKLEVAKVIQKEKDEHKMTYLAELYEQSKSKHGLCTVHCI